METAHSSHVIVPRSLRLPVPSFPPIGLGLLHDLSSAVQASVDGIAIVGTDARYRYVNEAHARIFGFAQPWELIGRSWRDLYDAAELARLEMVAVPAAIRDGAWRGECIG